MAPVSPVPQNTYDKLKLKPTIPIESDGKVIFGSKFPTRVARLVPIVGYNAPFRQCTKPSSIFVSNIPYNVGQGPYVSTEVSIRKASMAFADKDLCTLPTDFWHSAHSTPHRIHGTSKLVYWRNCQKVTLARYDINTTSYDTIKEDVQTTGQVKLYSGQTLVFIGDGGQVKEE